MNTNIKQTNQKKTYKLIRFQLHKLSKEKKVIVIQSYIQFICFQKNLQNRLSSLNLKWHFCFYFDSCISNCIEYFSWRYKMYILSRLWEDIFFIRHEKEKIKIKSNSWNKSDSDNFHWAKNYIDTVINFHFKMQDTGYYIIRISLELFVIFRRYAFLY